MDELLKILQKNALESPANLSKMLGIPEDQVKNRIMEYEKKGVIRGYQAIVNEDSLELNKVCAVIEVKITPERDGGFDHIAGRIGRFTEVESMHLMSGAYDLMVIVSGSDLKSVASFVSEKLATMEGIISTATHFILKTYKERGVLMEAVDEHERLKVSP